MDTRFNLVVTIMAAGDGKRMNSIVPKVLHIFGEKPILLRIIETARELDPRQIMVITSPKNYDFVVETLRQYTHIRDITFVIQERPLGTGDAIRSCLPWFSKSDAVLILNGDMPLISKDILAGFLEGAGKIIAGKIIAGRIIAAKFANPTGYGRMIIDPITESLTGIIEEKDCSDIQRQIQIVNSGIYLFSGLVLKEFVPKIANNNAQKEYYLTDIVRAIHSEADINVNIGVHLIDESLNQYISGVNTREELMELERFLPLESL